MRSSFNASVIAAAILAMVVGCAPASSLSPSPAPIASLAAPVASVSPTRATVASPEAGAKACPIGVHIPPGTYGFKPLQTEILIPLTMTFDAPGWLGCGLMYKELPAPQGVMMIGFWNVQNVYRDSCHWRESLADPPIGSGVSDLIEAVAAQATSEAGTPLDVTIGGYKGRYVRFEVDANLDTSGCDVVDVAEFRFWNGIGESVWWLGARDAPGLIGEVWALDVQGQRVVVQAASFSDAPESARDEIDRMVESIEFQP